VTPASIDIDAFDEGDWVGWWWGVAPWVEAVVPLSVDISKEKP
jgi:hypothetical protein